MLGIHLVSSLNPALEDVRFCPRCGQGRRRRVPAADHVPALRLRRLLQPQAGRGGDPAHAGRHGSCCSSAGSSPGRGCGRFPAASWTSGSRWRRRRRARSMEEIADRGARSSDVVGVYSRPNDRVDPDRLRGHDRRRRRRPRPRRPRSRRSRAHEHPVGRARVLVDRARAERLPREARPLVTWTRWKRSASSPRRSSRGCAGSCTPTRPGSRACSPSSSSPSRRPRQARLAAAIYGIGLVALFTVSATYHRWPGDPRWKPWLRRMDHATIFVFIAASYTPVALLVLDTADAGRSCSPPCGPARRRRRRAERRVDQRAARADRRSPTWPSAGSRSSRCRELAEQGRASRRSSCSSPAARCTRSARPSTRSSKPNLWPRTFGFHEVFHTLVIAAAVVHFIAIAGWVVPSAGG